MKDEELKLEEVEASHTLGGAGEGQEERNMYPSSETLSKGSRRNSHQGVGSVAKKTHEPGCTCALPALGFRVHIW